MSIQMTCPGCGHDYTLSDELQGKKIRCKKCEEIFTVNGAAKRVADDAIEPADKPRPGPRAAAPPAVRRRGADGETAIRSGTRSGARPVRRRGEDEEDETPAPGKKGAAPKNTSNKLPLIIGGAVLGVVLLVGGVVGAIFLMKGGDDDSNTQAKNPNPPTQPTSSKTTQPAGGQELVKKNDGGKDELLPANPFSPVAHPEAPKGNDPAAKGDANAGLAAPQDAIDRAKKSTVYIDSVDQEGGGHGSGFFGAEPGIILTNAHVIGMLRPNSPPPTNLKVIINSGESDEWAVEGKSVRILGVDRRSDLAVLKIDVPKDKTDKVPPHLKVLPTSTVKIGQDVFTVGFPGGFAVNKVASLRKSSVSAFFDDEETRERWRIQLEGGVDAGNSGGPVINVNGEVVGITAEKFGATTIGRAIPGDHVFRVLNGRVNNVVLKEPYRESPSQPIKLPVEVELIDPLHRVKEVGIDFWTGVPGDPRPSADKPPEPSQGDSHRQSVTLVVDKAKHVAKGELTLPDPDPEKVYWRQAYCITGEGKKTWAEGAVCSVTLPPAERRPATLIAKHVKGSSRTVELISRAAYRVFDADGHMDERAYAIKTNLTETTNWVKKGTAEVALKYDSLQMRRMENGRPAQLKSIENSVRDVQHLRGILQLDEWGNITNSRTDVRNVPDVSREWLGVVGDQVEISLSTLAVKLLNTRLTPLQEWEGVRELITDPAGKLQTGMLKIRYKYLGVRRRAGREEAVIEMTAEVAPLAALPAGLKIRDIPLKADNKAKGSGRGTAILDLATGQVTMAQMTADVETEITIQIGDGGPMLRRRAGGQLEVSLRRGTSVGQ